MSSPDYKPCIDGIAGKSSQWCGRWFCAPKLVARGLDGGEFFSGNTGVDLGAGDEDD